MAKGNSSSNDLVFGLDDRPGFSVSTFAALQHVLASFIGIITPTLIVGGVLGLGSEIPYLVSMALIVSGIGTFIQARRFGPIGSGLLCVQGTSFAFLSSILAAGFIVKNRGGTPEDILATIFGVCFLAASVEIILSRFIDKLKKIITPIVTGTIITLIGLHLIKIAMTDIAGGFGAPDLGSPVNLLLASLVLITIVIFNRFQVHLLRLSAVIMGLTVGFVVAWSMGKVDFSTLSTLPLVSVPVPFKYGFNFDLAAFIPIAIIYVITALETTGDLTANSMVSKQPVTGPLFVKRIKGGVLGDGVNSAIAASLNSLPMTTFSQNNGVIQLTGVASRYVAVFIAGILVLLGLFPIIGGVLQQMPKPVLGGATLIMFGTVAMAGVKIIAESGLDRRAMFITAISIGMGLGVDFVPEVLSSMPDQMKNIIGNPLTIGAFAAIFLNIILPEDLGAEESEAQAEEVFSESEAEAQVVVVEPNKS
ncbi:nucleobase:cation symporter-2 family protein [Amphritea balenae]|uniref:Purine permease n=1 Tax=Amphritea balenae TaxID=452629 RepID=A0A3P1SX22_9GAMM|nr:nucleobase:cation symporter-2 family protein [Amphritea balenae]RRD01659.1 purine permease [Amphritea balenae]GGK55232.1 xanthine permease [Amphritea balenae]